MSKYNVGDKFVIEIGEVIAGYKNNSETYRVKGFNSLVLNKYGLDKLGQLIQGVDMFSYNKGMEEAWEIATKVSELALNGEGFELFNKLRIFDVFSDFTVQEVKAKIEAWEESKKIRVGSQMINKETGEKSVVVMIHPEGIEIFCPGKGFQIIWDHNTSKFFEPTGKQ